MNNISKKLLFIVAALIILIAAFGGYWYFGLRKSYLPSEEVSQKKEEIKEFKKVDPNISSLPSPGENGEIIDQSVMTQSANENIKIIRPYQPLPTPK